MILPKRLEQGDTIAIIAPSAGLAALFPHRLEVAKQALVSLGYNVKLYPTTSYFEDGKAGVVEQRINDLHDAFKDTTVKAILCAIGGLSSNELLGKIDYELIKMNPKIFCGYSDITHLHHAIHNNTGLVTFYGPCAMTQFGENPQPLQYTLDYFFRAVSEQQPIGNVRASEEWTDELLDWGEKKDLERPRTMQENKGHLWHGTKKVTAPLTGGCLFSLHQLQGTLYAPDYEGKILFIETSEGQTFSKGEPLNYVDAQLMDLRNAGVFEKIVGLIVGRPFAYTPEETEKFESMILRHTNGYDFPVLLNANVGHADPIITLPIGVKATLDPENKVFSIDGPAVQ